MISPDRRCAGKPAHGQVPLSIYLGGDAGQRVLGGLVQRGDSRTIAAAIWYCDLRDFTAMSNELPRDEVIAVLNDYFDTMAQPVHKYGGEILKFIGDAMLAIFPMRDDLDRDNKCRIALAAAEAARVAARPQRSAGERRQAAIAGRDRPPCGLGFLRQYRRADRRFSPAGFHGDRPRSQSGGADRRPLPGARSPFARLQGACLALRFQAGPARQVSVARLQQTAGSLRPSG